MGMGMDIKRLVVFIFILFSSPMMFSLEVAEDEVTIPDTGDIVFENYSGPYTVVRTLDEIFGIGQALGRQEGNERETEGGQYRIVRAVDPETEEGFDADIFIVGPEGYVDHITNIRRRLAGYLEEAYQYSREDALLLAKFITYYNAVHRGDAEMIRERYKPVVMENLIEERIGLARSYRDWPGKTMMVIPLTRRAETGDFAALDSDELSDEEVVEDLRGEEDRGLDDRKELVELKEREIAAEEEDIEEDRRRIAEAEDSEEDAAEAGTAGAAEDGTEAGTAAKEGDAGMPEETAAAEDLEEREEQLAERKRRLEEEREEIAEDQQLVIEEEKKEERRREESSGPAVRTEEGPAEAAGKLFLLTDKNKRSMLARVDFSTGNYIVTSPVDTILGRKFYPLGDSILVVFENGGTGAALGLLDAETLELTGSSDTVVYDETYILVDGASIYAVVQGNKGWTIGRFDGSLTMQAKSAVRVAPYSIFIAEGKFIYMQKEDDVLTAFDKMTLD
jgi:hypothetical protein